MEDSQPDWSRVFSVRIVDIDYHMTPPIPEIDICYSSFQGGKVNEVPVIRIFGSSPAGQKTCLHVHKALPYLYVPCSNIQLSAEGQQVDVDYKNIIAHALEKALKLKGKVGSSRQHVHACTLVRARKLYGYFSNEELFVKIYLYHPQDVARAASLLLGGAVLDRSLQPHEAHIPFILQFLVDYNLYGMGFIHLSKTKFRHPIPDTFTQFSGDNQSSEELKSSPQYSKADSPVWVSSTVPVNWMWPAPDALISSSCNTTVLMKRISTCKLESDSTTDDIINQHNKVFLSQSVISSDVKMVQSLIPIWEEEYERTGLHNSCRELPPDHGKPCQADVLKILALGSELQHSIMELFYQAETSMNPMNEDEVKNSASCVDSMDICEDSVDTAGLPGSANIQQCIFSQDRGGDLLLRQIKSAGTSTPKSSAEEILGVLKWLASSQAIEDINSDDELQRETILSPLLPAASVKKVLELANDHYESESQRECQDILNSVVDASGFNNNNNNPELINEFQTPTDDIPQVDVSSDDHYYIPRSNSSSRFNSAESSLHLEVFNKSGTTDSHRSSRQWGVLPLYMPENMNGNHQDVSPSVVNKFDMGAIHLDPTRKKINFDVLVNTASSGPPEGTLTCSLRDLMRKKRSYRASFLEFETSRGIHDLDGQLNVSERFSESSAAGIEIMTKSVVLDDTSTSMFDDHQHYVEPFVDGPPSDAIERHVNQSSDAGVDGKGASAPGTCQGANVRMQAGNCNEECNGMTHSRMCIIVPVLDVDGSSDVPKITIHEAREGNLSDEWLSQCVKDSNVEMECENTYSGTENDRSCYKEPNTDANSHHCTYGTDIYMLTPASPPPTADLVCSWVSELEDSAARPCKEQLLYACSHSFTRGHMDGSNSEDKENKFVVVDAGCSKEKKFLVCEAEKFKKVVNNTSQDYSQISGPCGKSKTTPLSQTGFRDPASFGCGQQLTLLSLEVLAESRGDLRPDPRYDAIKVLAFAVKDDSDSVASLYALLNTGELNTRNQDGLSRCNILHFSDEKHLFNYLVDFIISLDPDVFLGWDIQGGSLGFLTERASQLGISLLGKISRTPSETMIDLNSSEGLEKILQEDVPPEQGNGDSTQLDGGPINDEWGRTHASGFNVDGRIVLNVWRLMRAEVKLTMYTVEAVAEAVLRRKVPLVSNRVLTSWFTSGPSHARYRSIDFVVERAKLNLDIMEQLDMINRTSELARVFGIEFFSVLSRGSQYRVESMLMRLAHSQNYIAISPGSQQVATQPAMECIPLVMEPKSGFYSDPVIVLDFQSLYPSMIIAYNLCFSTCLGKLAPTKPSVLGVSSYSPESNVLYVLKDQLLFTPNGVMYVPPEVRKGVLPRLLEEILSTRIMVKQAMKKLDSSQKVLQRIFNSRQMALKLISNVTYGYTAAGFSGRMPCAELADSIVQCGRRTLETAISFVNANEIWKARVIYGDTDSLFVLLKGRTVEEAFRVGKEIATEVTKMNPEPVTLKMEKVYHPCFLLTKKRYVGYSYESPEQVEPIFDAKGIETVRRDTCGAVAKTMEQSLRLYFENQDISKVKAYLQRQWKRIISGRVTLQDFIFAKEVRLGTYSTRNSSSLPPAAIVASQAMRLDPRAEPRYGERIPYIVVHGDPGARLVDMVVDPFDILALESPFRLNDQYYITKQIIPALQRVFGLVGADLSHWLSEIPRPIRESFGKRHLHGPNPYRARIDHYYMSKHCVLCGELAQSKNFCDHCSKNKTAMATTVNRKTSKLEKNMQHLVAICRHCGGGDWLVEPGVKCTSLACSVFFERRKVQKELLNMSTVATKAGLYPKCIAELF